LCTGGQVAAALGLPDADADGERLADMHLEVCARR
jgi:hypothetical protein